MIYAKGRAPGKILSADYADGRRSGFICANLRPSADHKALCGTMSRMSEAPLPMREHALDNIRFIRSAMERAGSFTSIPGWGGVGVGITAIISSAIAQQFLGRSLRMWLATWLAEAVVAAIIGFGTMALKARRSDERFMSGASRRFFIS